MKHKRILRRSWLECVGIICILTTEAGKKNNLVLFFFASNFDKLFM